MSLTPDPHFNGDNTCVCCDKPMYANDVGVIYRPQKREDFMFCIECATQMTMSIAQDIARINPDIGLSYYFKFKGLEASAANLRRHANGLKKLVTMMEDHADSMAYMHHPDEDKA
jgi:hypothetical protein